MDLYGTLKSAQNFFVNIKWIDWNIWNNRVNGFFFDTGIKNHLKNYKMKQRIKKSVKNCSGDSIINCVY